MKCPAIMAVHDHSLTPCTVDSKVILVLDIKALDSGGSEDLRHHRKQEKKSCPRVYHYVDSSVSSWKTL